MYGHLVSVFFYMSEAFLFLLTWLCDECIYHRALSEVPNAKAIAGVRVALIGGEFIVNPTVKEMEESQLDLFLAGTDTAILTIEVKFNLYLSLQDLHIVDSALVHLQGYSNFLPEEMLLQAVKIGQVISFFH